MAQKPSEHPAVRVAQSIERLLDFAKDDPLGPRLVPQQERAQRGRQGQRAECRDRDRGGDRQRELAVDRAGRARKKRNRHEHGDQHDRDRDHRARYLAHALARCLERGELLLLHQPLDVLDHHDRVVDDQTGGQSQAEQSQGVDRKPEQIDEGEGAEQGDGQSERRDQDAAPAVQKREDHQDHQRDRLGEGYRHLVDRCAYRERRVGSRLELEPGWELFAQAIHLGHHRVAHVEGVGRRQLENAEADCISATAEAHELAVVLGSELDFVRHP